MVVILFSVDMCYSGTLVARLCHCCGECLLLIVSIACEDLGVVITVVLCVCQQISRQFSHQCFLSPNRVFTDLLQYQFEASQGDAVNLPNNYVCSAHRQP